MKTFDQVLAENRGIGPGFDFLRVSLSLSIVLCHSFLVAEGERHQLNGAFVGTFRESLVPMFFALSGFLITASAMRLRLKDFLVNRAMRILPALLVDVCVAALILGPIFTTLPLSEYFRGSEFRVYFANIIGMVCLYLPGVFDGNPFPRIVNVSLWTIPFEIACYAIMSVIILTGLLKRPRWMLAFTAAVIAAVCVIEHLFGASLDGGPPTDAPLLHKILYRFFYLYGLSLYPCFLFGCLAYLYRRYIPFNGLIALGCAATIVAVAALLPAISQWTICRVLSPLLVYVALYIGLSPIPKLPIYSRGDYSYGIYLYGFPVQQALVVMFPSIVSPWINFALSATIVTAIAIGSWHFVEKPTLALRRKFSFTARKGDDTPNLPQASKPLIAAPEVTLVPAGAHGVAPAFASTPDSAKVAGPTT
jgi:peptidoglycan/LPS O-acetylase OafA/YrhL